MTALKNRLEIFLEKHFSGNTMDYRTVIAITLPILVDQTFIVCLGLLNTAMISSSGVAAVSAVNMVDSLNNFLANVFIAVSTGGTVVVAQYKGNGNNEMVSKAAAGSISSVILMAFSISVLFIVFHMPALGLLFGGAEADVLHNARIYLIGSAASYCGLAGAEAVCGALRGIGETKSSLVISVILNVSYVVLNGLFIGILHMGVFGMVISLNIARYLGALYAFVYLIRRNTTLAFRIRSLLQVRFSMVKKIMFIGLPFAAEQMFFNGGKILTQTFIVKLGTYALAVNAICGSISMLFQIPANAFCLAVITVVGQCIGRREIDDARKFIRSFLWLSSFSFVALTVLIMPFYRPLVAMFSPPDQIIHTIFIILVVNAAAQALLWSISFVTPSALRAAGDSNFTSVVSMLSMWLFRVVLGYILGVVLPFGIIGVWLAMDCEWGVRGLVFMLRFKGKKWYRHQLIEQ